MGGPFRDPLGDIQSAELLEELPEISRKVGTGLPSVQKGRYSAEGYGEVTACLAPRTGPWILVTEEDGTQYLLGSTDGNAAEIDKVLENVGIP